MVVHRLGWNVGAMVSGEWNVYSVRERLWSYYGRGARIISALVRNSSTATLTEESTRQELLKGERKRVDYPGGADFVGLKASAATTAGQVTVDLEVEVK